MSTIIMLAVVAAIILVMAFGDILMTLAMYALYRYDGGHRPLQWYINFMENTEIEW